MAELSSQDFRRESSRGAVWRVSELLDYEVVVQRSEESDFVFEGQSPRRWFVASGGGGGAAATLLGWVRSCRTLAGAPLPGRAFGAVLSVLSLAAVLLGGCGGAALGWGVLAYAGDAAVNLLAVLFVLVGVPLLFTVASVVMLCLPSGVRGGAVSARAMWLLRSAIGVARRWRLLDRAGADGLLGACSRISARSQRYAGVSKWVPSAIWQMRSAAFHAGILVAVFWRGLVQDMAFGWQTTLQVDAERVHALATAVAWPWRQWGGVPTLEQVAGSRVVLKEGIDALSNSDLAAWWPYVCCAVTNR